MKYVYTVTLELETPWWLKFFRFLRLAKKMETFDLTFNDKWCHVGETLKASLINDQVLVLSVKEHKNQSRCSPGC